MERETTEIVNKTALNLIDRAQKLKDGSEEQKRLLDSASTLLKSLNEDYKLKEDAVDRRYQIEVNKKHSEEEIEVKKLQIKEEAKSKKQGNIFKCGFVALAVLVDVGYQKGGYLLPKYVSRWLPGPKD